MLINELKVKSSAKTKPKKRVGRGGKRGSFSGRGIKGQKARSGHRIRPAERDLIQRLPKLRGFKNRRLGNSLTLTLDKLNNLQSKVVSIPILKKAGVLNQNFRGRIKIVARGKIEKPITIVGIPVSAAASEMIRAAGGAIESKIAAQK